MRLSSAVYQGIRKDEARGEVWHPEWLTEVALGFVFQGLEDQGKIVLAERLESN